MPYPQWSYYPRNARPPKWATELVSAVALNKEELDTTNPQADTAERITSDRALAILRPAMESLGYTVESGKAAGQRIERPVLFGDNGLPTVKYEIDAFHDELGIAVEVEAGRGAKGNADYRDIVRTSLLLDADYFVLMLPGVYRFKVSGKAQSVLAYKSTRDQLDAIYASKRLVLPFIGVLLVGY